MLVAAAAIAVVLASGRMAAQSALAALGLTEAAAQTFVLNDVKSPASDRRADIAVAGTRAFLKLPVPARAAAASGLFTWARAYVSSPAFAAVYAQHRRNVGADSTNAASVDDEVRKKIESELAQLADLKKEAASMPAELAAKMLATVKTMEDNIRSPQMVNAYRQEIEAARDSQTERGTELSKRLPADPHRLIAMRLHEFLDATASANFSARTIALTGGPDGIEFLDRVEREKHWIAQLAAIAGPDATAAARTAAQTWLKEIER